MCWKHRDSEKISYFALPLHSTLRWIARDRDWIGKKNICISCLMHAELDARLAMLAAYPEREKAIVAQLEKMLCRDTQ